MNKVVTAIVIVSCLFWVTPAFNHTVLGKTDLVNNKGKPVKRLPEQHRGQKTGKMKKKTKPRTYYPAEKITADQAVAFPADI